MDEVEQFVSIRYKKEIIMMRDRFFIRVLFFDKLSLFNHIEENGFFYMIKSNSFSLDNLINPHRYLVYKNIVQYQFKRFN